MKTIYLCILFLVLTYFTVSSNNQLDTNCYENISCADLNLLNSTKELFIIDVRYYKDYKKERIENAYSAKDKNSISLLLKDVDKSETIYVYCYVGVKSKKISKYICKELNYNNVYNIEGGIGEWKKQGFALDKSNVRKKNN